RGVRIGAEVWIPGAYGRDVSSTGLGRIGVVLWGVRLFGQSFWGDIALADLICDGCGSLYRVLPLGIPFLNLGVGWWPLRPPASEKSEPNDLDIFIEPSIAALARVGNQAARGARGSTASLSLAVPKGLTPT